VAVIRSAPTSEPSTLRESLKDSFAALQTLAETAPHIYAHKRDLALAEYAGLEGHDIEAMRLYEQAVRSALEKGFIQEAALGAELAANFFAGSGLERIAQSYRHDARDYYRRWGALGKVAQLDRCYPEAAPKVPQPHLPTVETSLEHLDLVTVIRMSQAVAGELLLNRLIETLMTIAIEHAGADRGLLILPHGDDLRVGAEAKSTAETVSVRLVGRDTPAPGLPATVLAHVRRTQQPVILDDARAKTPFAADSYLRLNRVRSVLCLPLVKQGELSGILYLENSLASHVFTPARITVLMVLSSQTAISLENTRLYNDLAEREARIRRLVDANIIGIAIGDLDGHIREANDAFLRTVGYDRDDLVTSRLRWTDLTPPERLDGDARRGIPELRMAGTLQPYEDEFVRKDGSRVPVLVGGALFQEGGSECVAFMLDLTERNRAERALRDLEADLAHMNRLSVMGELAASLAHELKQPIGSARNNARAALNFLKKRPPDLGEVREALDCVVGDADRAANIVDRIRDHIKKAPPRRDWFDLNNAIDEIIVLAHSAISKNEVTVQTRLKEGPFPVQGDRVQLQQVVLNLILNAVEAMNSVESEERELLITTERSQTNCALVAVKDSGPGIDPEQLNRVFEGFYTTKAGGLGMGLLICRSIINAHGGRLWAVSNEPRGAIVKFTLPNAETDS
jgi:PAS domain S-box-containing protein